MLLFCIFNSSKKSKDSRPSVNKFKLCTKCSLPFGSYSKEITEETGTKLPLFFISYKDTESTEVTFPKSHSRRDYNSRMVLHPTLRAVRQDSWPCEDSFSFITGDEIQTSWSLVGTSHCARDSSYSKGSSSLGLRWSSVESLSSLRKALQLHIEWAQCLEFFRLGGGGRRIKSSR